MYIGTSENGSLRAVVEYGNKKVWYCNIFSEGQIITIYGYLNIDVIKI